MGRFTIAKVGAANGEARNPAVGSIEHAAAEFGIGYSASADSAGQEQSANRAAGFRLSTVEPEPEMVNYSGYVIPAGPPVLPLTIRPLTLHSHA
jgi:hypothetical protein